MIDMSIMNLFRRRDTSKKVDSETLKRTRVLCAKLGIERHAEALHLSAQDFGFESVFEALSDSARNPNIAEKIAVLLDLAATNGNISATLRSIIEMRGEASMLASVRVAETAEAICADTERNSHAALIKQGRVAKDQENYEEA